MKPAQVDQMSMQEAMDFAMKKIVEQGGQCSIMDTCAYGKGDMHCAIGWLLDEDDKRLMDFQGGFPSLVDYAGDEGIELPELLLDNQQAFDRLQDVHDQADSTSFHAMKDLERDYDIDISGPHWAEWLTILEVKVPEEE